jgi:hypothetical protein
MISESIMKFIFSLLIINVLLISACKNEELEVNEFVKNFNHTYEDYYSKHLNSDIKKVIAIKDNDKEISVNYSISGKSAVLNEIKNDLQAKFTSNLLKSQESKNLLFKGVTFKIRLLDLDGEILDSAFVNGSNMSDLKPTTSKYKDEAIAQVNAMFPIKNEFLDMVYERVEIVNVDTLRYHVIVGPSLSKKLIEKKAFESFKNNVLQYMNLNPVKELMNELDIKVVNYVYHNKNGDVLNSTNMSIKELDSAIKDQNN